MLLQTIEDLIDSVTFKCFDECVFPVTHRLTNRDKECVDVCMARFTTARSIVVKMLQD
jgi:hypothetical protein